MQPVTLPPGLQSDAVDASTGSSRARAAFPPAAGTRAARVGYAAEATVDARPTVAGHSPGAHAHTHAGHSHATERRMRSFADFACIRERGVEVAHWHRPHAAVPDLLLPSDERQWKGAASDALADPTLPLAILPDAASRDRLLAEVHDLTAAFLVVAEGFRVEANLSVVHGVQCPKWHVDHVAFRLTCTFRGPGTEWVCGDHADRSMLGRPSDCLVTANRRIVPDGGHVHRAAAGDIVLLKGRGFGPEDPGAVHRSPEVDASTGPRLVWALTARGA